MNVLYFLIPVALLIAFGFLFGFIWSVRQGHFDDLETPAQKILVDDEKQKGISNG